MISDRKPLHQVCKTIEQENEVGQQYVEIYEVKVIKSNKQKDILKILRLQIIEAELSLKNPDNVMFNNKEIVIIEKMNFYTLKIHRKKN